MRDVQSRCLFDLVKRSQDSWKSRVKQINIQFEKTTKKDYVGDVEGKRLKEVHILGGQTISNNFTVPIVQASPLSAVLERRMTNSTEDVSTDMVH